jgi:hypothetical protein
VSPERGYFVLIKAECDKRCESSHSYTARGAKSIQKRIRRLFDRRERRSHRSRRDGAFENSSTKSLAINHSIDEDYTIHVDV